jgi:hypothetical protein
MTEIVIYKTLVSFAMDQLIMGYDSLSLQRPSFPLSFHTDK